MRKLQVALRPLDKLIPYARNARTHDEGQVAQIAASIREFGWTNPILIDEAGGIIAGHGRVLAARLLGEKRVPTITLTGLTEAQRRAYILADNKLALNAGWNEELLKLELKDLEGKFDLSIAGFSPLELEDLIGLDAPVRTGKTDEDAVPEPPKKAKSHPGDVWTLGRHRLICADATHAKAYEKLLEDEPVDILWTDPPYNVDYEGAAGKIQGDKQGDGEFFDFLENALGRACENALGRACDVMRAGAVAYVSHADSARVVFTEAFVRAGFKLSQVLIWVKHAATLSRQDYNWRHEPILYGWREGAAHYFCGDFTLTTVSEDVVDLTRATKKELVAMIKTLQEARSSVIHENKPARSELHPTMKPVALIRRMIEASSLEHQVVLDPFGGSGSTLIAAEQTNRNARLIEIDPKYCDVIVRRWEEFTGKKATLQAAPAKRGVKTPVKTRKKPKGDVGVSPQGVA